MKRYLFLVLFLASSIAIAEEAQKEEKSNEITKAIIETFKKHKLHRFDDLAIWDEGHFIQLVEKNEVINNQITQLYETCLKNEDLDELAKKNKSAIAGYFLAVMKERKISSDASSFVDEYTACEKNEDGSCYLCHSRVPKEWADQL